MREFCLLTAALIFFTLTINACSKDSAGEGADDETETQVHAVKAERLERSDLRKFIETNGNVRAENSTNVYPIMAGKIAGARVRLGSKVKKGDVLAYVDPSSPGSNYALNAVTAPINGTVISIPLKEGTRVNTETAVVTIGDLSKLQIITYVPERYVSYLKIGLEADIVLEAYPDEIFRATASEVSPVLDEATRTKELVLAFKDSDKRVNAGMFASVKLYLKTYENVFSVPSSCVIEKMGKKYVYLINESSQTARFAEILTGEEIDGRAIIEFANNEAALTADGAFARVVVQGFETLQDGSVVNVAD